MADGTAPLKLRPTRAAKRRLKAKGRKVEGPFLAMPRAVLDSPAFLSLSLKSRALLLDLGVQYRGNNNGDLSAPWSYLRKRGWKSRQTIERAIKELLDVGLIEKTRQGGLHWPNLYALGWQPIDECGGKLEVLPTAVAPGRWRNCRPDSRAKVARQ